VFVGETGYSTYWGTTKQATVYTEIFDWLGGQKKVGGKTVPLFAFDAFDRPSVTSPADEAQYGIYGENSSSKPTGLKSDLVGIIPGWTSKPIGTGTNGANSLYGTKGGETIKALGGNDIVLGLGGDDRLFGQRGSDLLVGNNGADLLRGGGGADFLDGARGRDILKGGAGDDTLVGGKHRDLLEGGSGADTFVFDFKMTANSAARHRDKIIDFDASEDSIHLKQSEFSELAVGALPDDDAHITYKHDALFYDGIKFAKFTSHAPATLGDIDIVVYA